MRRILIVDDEPFIVNGLAGMIKEADFTELEVYKANSAAEAIQWFERTSMDIVLTDISMPGMNGLELQKRIVQQWPRSKVIFLTGYNDFSYVKEAIHHRAVDYILKTEGDQAILAAVNKAMEELNQEIERGAQFEKAQAQLHAALPFLQKEYLLELLHGELQPNSTFQKQMNELSLSFIESDPVLLFIGKVDEWSEYSSADKALLLYGVQNIADEYMKSSVKLESITYDKTRIAWLIQPLASNHDLMIDERRLARFVLGTVERIQQTCKELLKLKLSFVVSNECCTWFNISERFEELNRVMRRNFGMGHELLLTDVSAEMISIAPLKDSQTKMLQKQTSQLELCLVSGQQIDFKRKLMELMNDSDIRSDADLRLIASYQLLSMIMTYAMNEGFLKVVMENTELNRLLNQDSQGNWEETIILLIEIGDTLFKNKVGMTNQHSRSLVTRIKKYIDENLSEDLSLTRLGELVSLNPFYLSRLYKQLTGEGLSDTIMTARLAEAKRLLKDTNDKVQDIAMKVGFESAAYFNRFFKKSTEYTPQAYREYSRK
jgi:two-component system, response regulator YesN